MAKRKSESTVRKLRPALNPDARENQLISLAMDVAEQQMRDGTASPQLISHFLKLGSSRNRYEMRKLQREVDLLEAKKESLESAQRVEAMYAEAMAAMRSYSGSDEGIEDED